MKEKTAGNTNSPLITTCSLLSDWLWPEAKTSCTSTLSLWGEDTSTYGPVCYLIPIRGIITYIIGIMVIFTLMHTHTGQGVWQVWRGCSGSSSNRDNLLKEIVKEINAERPIHRDRMRKRGWGKKGRGRGKTRQGDGGGGGGVRKKTLSWDPPAMPDARDFLPLKYSPFFSSLFFFVPQRNRSWAHFIFHANFQYSCAAAAAADLLSHVLPRPNPCRLAPAWHWREGWWRAREDGRRGGGVKWGPVLQRQCRANTMQMQHNAVVLGEALQMRQGNGVQRKAATPSLSQARQMTHTWPWWTYMINYILVRNGNMQH